jgi:predicted MFS family arabinose efflux permease
MRLWAAQTVSAFGARIARDGLVMAAILSLHARSQQLGILAALTLAPSLIVGLFAGGFVDRSSRRGIMIGADLARTALLLTIPLAAWFGLLTMTQLYVAALLVGAATVLFGIADHAFLPSLIEPVHLVDGNTKLGITDSVAEIGGPALAGTLFQVFTAPFAMLVTALTYLVSAAFLFAIPSRQMPPDPDTTNDGWVRDLHGALRAVLHQPLVRPLFWATFLSSWFGAFFAGLYLAYGIDVLGLSPALLGIVIACGGVGALAGAGLSSFLCRRIGVGPTIVSCSFVVAIAVMLIPLAGGSLWLRVSALIAAQLLGDSMGVAALIPMTSLRQAVFPRGMLGRIAALFSATGGLAAIFGALTGGYLGAHLGIRATLYIAAASYVLPPLFVIFSPLARLKEIPSIPSPAP